MIVEINSHKEKKEKVQHTEKRMSLELQVVHFFIETHSSPKGTKGNFILQSSDPYKLIRDRTLGLWRNEHEPKEAEKSLLVVSTCLLDV